MKKKIIVVIIFIVLIIVFLYLFGIGGKRTDVYLQDYSVSSDGNTIKIKVGVSSSIGYIRNVRIKQSGTNQFLTFYSTFGINNKINSRNEFIIDINELCEEIYFYDDDSEYFYQGHSGYKCVLERDSNEEWILSSSKNKLSQFDNESKNDLTEDDTNINQTIIENEKNNLKGSIVEIGKDYIVVQDQEDNKKYKVVANPKTSQFVNHRTTGNLSISDIKIGDYYYGDKEIIRNISGDEWKKECIENLANCYVEGMLICNPQNITNIQDMGKYVIITLTMEDSTTKYFNGKENCDTFELKAIAYPALNIPTVSGGVTVYNLKEETDGFMFWIGLDKNTVNNQYPTINNIDIYDK